MAVLEAHRQDPGGGPLCILVKVHTTLAKNNLGCTIKKKKTLFVLNLSDPMKLDTRKVLKRFKS